MGLEIQSTTLLLVALVISFLLSFSISIVYFEYLKKGGSWRIAFQFFVFLPVLISLITIFYTAITSNPVTTVFYYFIFSFVLLLFVGKLPRFKCKKMKKIDKIENLHIFICYEKKGKIYNAWYNLKKKEIGITKSLFEILSDEERKAVFYHEVGHSKVKFWDIMTRLTCFLWLISVSLILTMCGLIVFLSGYDWLNKIVFSATYLAFLPIYAVSFMISSWINEHEADGYAVRSIGFKPKARPLIKLYVYSSLKGCKDVIFYLWLPDLFELDEIPYF
ncbi:hypothetical protein DRO97_08620 [Archaeoglobales archaeon]|nr:MAG: hypothetical protein DRO97_08620 [Archaeoglobales archaeon]